MSRVLDWLDDRTGYRGALAHALDEPVAGGASFAYAFGSVLVFILAQQAITGVFLAMYYSPSASDAWASVAYIQDQVTMGWFIRGLHHHGASAMVIVAGLHLLQVAVYGAYKKPREVTWIIGVLMLGLIMTFALTGYLLPWDQTGYWATKVATGIAGTSPVIGEQIQQVAQAGNEYGNLTITRFFAIHVFLLPGALIALVVVHVALFRSHGVTPKWGRAADELERSQQPFWPDQMFKDMVAMAIAFAALVTVTVLTGGAGLDAPADPSSNFDARPEWYFRPLFQALKYFSGSLEVVVSLGLPVVVAAALLALPFVDRGPERDPRKRAPFLGVLGAGFVTVAVLAAISFRQDANDGALQERRAVAEELAAKARRLAAEFGVPPEGGLAVFTMEPGYRGRALWASECAPCHEGDAREGPEIDPGYNSRAWIRAFFGDPSGERFFGLTKIDDMKPVKQTGAELDALVELVYAETGAIDADRELAAKGRAVAEDASCSNCHAFDGETEDEVGPNLGGRGSIDMLVRFIAEPDHPLWFGNDNEMTRFAGKLSADDLRALAEHVVALRDQPYAPPPAPVRTEVGGGPAAGATDAGAEPQRAPRPRR